MEEFTASPAAQVRYLVRRIDELARIEISEPVDFELAKKWGHQVKGNAESFGFPELTASGIELEKFAEAKDTVKVRLLSHQILNSLRKLMKEVAP
ncbi:MAG: hypothetical protein J7501_16240 [Bdellovibrio sp.]|nr:hypothetical protein [Bdellovibrio sp.]